MNKETQISKMMQTEVVFAEKSKTEISSKVSVKTKPDALAGAASLHQQSPNKSDKAPEKSRTSAKKKKEDGDTEVLLDPTVSLEDTTVPGESQLLFAQANTSTTVMSDAGGGRSDSTVAAGTSETTASSGIPSAGSGFSPLGLLGGLAVLGALGGGGGGGGGGGTVQSIQIDTSAPTIESVVADGTKITLTYSEVLNSSNPPKPSAFAVSIGGIVSEVKTVEVIDKTVVLTMAQAIPKGTPVSVAYQDPTVSDDAEAIQDAAGNDAANFTNMVVADGYIRGASVYIDSNNNGQIDVGTDILAGITDQNGNIVIPGNLPTGTLLVQGGVNIDTGVPNTMLLKGPKGSTAITPLTTLIQTVVEKQVAANPNTVVDATLIQEASAKVATALGLTDSLVGNSLTNYDPIAKNNTVVQKAAAQVATIVAMASGGDAAVSAEVISKLTTAITDNGTAPAITLDSGVLLDAILPSGLSQGVKDKISEASDKISNAGSISAISDAQSEFLDQTAAAQPSLDAPKLTNNPDQVAVKVLLENKATDGTAVVAGDTIHLKDGSVTLVAAAPVTSIDVAVGFKVIEVSFAGAADSEHTLTAEITDQNGNVSSSSAGFVVVVDTTVAAPVVAQVTADNVVNTAEKTAGVAVSGTAEAGASVSVTWGTTTKTVTATDGSWTANFASGEVPTDDSTTISAVATDVAGNVSAKGEQTVTVDTAVAAPVIAAVAADNVVNAAEKTAAEKTAGVAVSGTAEAGASVSVTWGATTLTDTAADDGAWTVNFGVLPEEDGSSTISAVATDVAGNVSAAGTKDVKLDTLAPTATATIRTVEDNVPSTTVAEVAKDSITNDNTPTLFGDLTAALAVGEVLAVYDGSTRLGIATVTNTGWSFESTSLSNGDHSMTVVVEDSAGNQGAVSAAYAFKVNATVPAATAAVAAMATAVNTDKPVISGTITGTMATDDVVKVFDGNSLLGNATVNGSTWSFTPSVALTQGQHKITAVVENAGGTQSALSSEMTFTVDSVAPSVPVLTSFSDNSGLTTDNITNDKTVTFNMTSEAGSQLEIFSDNTSLGLATESATAGTFSFTTASLTDGSYNFRAVAKDAAGNAATLSSIPVVIDTVAPAKPVIKNWSDTDDT
jgi:hypothetical protein